MLCCVLLRCGVRLPIGTIPLIPAHSMAPNRLCCLSISTAFPVRLESIAEARLEKIGRAIPARAFRCCVPARPPGIRLGEQQGRQDLRRLQGQEEETLQTSVRRKAHVSVPAEELLFASHGEQRGHQDIIVAVHLHAECEAGENLYNQLLDYHNTWYTGEHVLINVVESL